MPLAPGARLDSYEVIAAIGAGGMGEVYRARDTRLNRQVAVKVLPESLTQDSDRLRRFQLEAQSTSALNHPNILTVYDVGAQNGAPYLVMELLEGETLRERLQRGKLSPARAISYARQIAAGLGAAHAKGITHRDIKPDNLFITKDHRIKILDFGLAKQELAKTSPDGATQSVVTSAGTVMGTVSYMAPEQVRGFPADARSDIFSFGCVLYEMLTGRRPFTGDSPVETMNAILKEDPPEISSTGAVVPASLQQIVGHCLEKAPEARFQSASDLGFALGAITPTESGPQQLPGPVRAGAASRLNGLHALVTAAALIGCALLAYLYFRPAPALKFHRLTFRRGIVHAARFTPDSAGAVYSGQWEDEPDQVFTVRFDDPGSRPLGLSGDQIRSTSRDGQLAILQRCRVNQNPFAPAGLLAQVSISGGTPRPLAEHIDFAEWGPNGKDMLVVHETGTETTLEYPIGKVLYQTAGYISEPRFSPDGQHIGFLDHERANDNAGSVAVIDLAGKKQNFGHYLACQGLAWSPRGDEIWFTGSNIGSRNDLRAVTLSGKERMLLSQAVGLVLQDISTDGRVLVTAQATRMKLLFRGPEDKRERELSWFDWSLLRSLSPDGKLITFDESGEGAGDRQLSFLRETNGAPSVFLGKSSAANLSEDGKWVVAYDDVEGTIVVYPVGPGQTRRVPVPGYTLVNVGLFPDDEHLWFAGYEPGHTPRYYRTDFNGTKPVPLTPEGARPVSPSLCLNGRFFAVKRGERIEMIPVDGNSGPVPTGFKDAELVAGWTEDGNGIYVSTREIPTPVDLLEWKTGKRTRVMDLMPADRAGLATGMNGVRISRDGKSYAYSLQQDLDELHVLEGLK